MNAIDFGSFHVFDDENQQLECLKDRLCLDWAATVLDVNLAQCTLYDKNEMSKRYRAANYYHVTATVTKETAVRFSLAEIFHDDLWN